MTTVILFGGAVVEFRIPKGLLSDQTFPVYTIECLRVRVRACASASEKSFEFA